jgi:hypothetical protein
MKIEDATVHGFRLSFQDWAGNVSSFPREVTETALAHVIGDKAEQAYRRSDALEKRRRLMERGAPIANKSLKLTFCNFEQGSVNWVRANATAEAMCFGTGLTLSGEVPEPWILWCCIL